MDDAPADEQDEAVQENDADAPQLLERNEESEARDLQDSAILRMTGAAESLAGQLEERVARLGTVRLLPPHADRGNEKRLRSIHRGLSFPAPDPFVNLLKARGVTDFGHA